MTDFEAGTTFDAEVHVTPRGNLGSVELPTQKKAFMTIGPVNCDSGTRVHVKYLGAEDENNAAFGLCLTDSVRADDYDEWKESIHDQLLADEPPEPGEITLAKIDRVTETGIGYIGFEDQDICVGPTDVTAGTVVEIEGVNSTHAKLRAKRRRGENYEARFAILAGQYDSLPIFIGQEINIPIAGDRDGTPLAYIDDVPILFPGADVGRARVVKAEITGFEADTAVAEILEITDEVRAVADAGQWARLHWLKNAGIDKERPLHDFASRFFELPQTRLPESTERIQEALVAEAIRLGLWKKSKVAEADRRRVHVMGLRHWVVRKLAALFDDPSDDDDWFRDTLTDSPGPTMTFLGDVVELAGGYYRPGQTRAIPIGDSDAVIISGRPTAHFDAYDVDIEIRGTARVLTDVDESEVSDAGIPLQSRDQYLGIESQPSFDPTDLAAFIARRDATEWEPASDWNCYQVNSGPRFGWAETEVDVQLPETQTRVGLWKHDPERAQPEYWLKYESTTADRDAQMVQIPNQYYKQICLALNAAAGRPRYVEFTSRRDYTELRCGFAPPAAQLRWLQAIGAEWLEPTSEAFCWRLPPESHEAIADVFDQLAVTITDSTH